MLEIDTVENRADDLRLGQMQLLESALGREAADHIASDHEHDRRGDVRRNRGIRHRHDGRGIDDDPVETRFEERQ